MARALRRGAARGDTRARQGRRHVAGAANALLLALWGRVDPEEVGVAVFGEVADWTRFQTAAAI